MTKRLRKETEFEDLSEVTSPSPNAKIHGVVTALSPIKKSKTSSSCNYFDGEISNGNKSMRIFGFDSAAGVRRKLLDFETKRTGVTLSQCEVQASRNGEALEIKLHKYTEVEQSDKVFDMANIAATVTGKTILLNELGDQAQFTRVSAAVKAIHLEEPIEASNGSMKQDVVVADATGTARLTVWEKEIDSLEEMQSYQLSGMRVREYLGKKFLSTSKENSKITKVDDIRAVVQEVEAEADEDSGNISYIKNSRIVGVLDLDTFNSCIKCNAKVVQDDDDEDLSKCVKCQMTQCTDACTKQLSIRVMIQSDNGKFTLIALNFGKLVYDILRKTPQEIDANNITKGMLLKAPLFSFAHSGGIIQSIRKV